MGFHKASTSAGLRLHNNLCVVLAIIVTCHKSHINSIVFYVLLGISCLPGVEVT